MRDRARRLFATVLDCPGGLAHPDHPQLLPDPARRFPGRSGDHARASAPSKAARKKPWSSARWPRWPSSRRRATARFSPILKCLPGGSAKATSAATSAAAPARSRGWRASSGWQMSKPKLRALMDLPEEGVEELVAERCHEDAFNCDALHALADAYRALGHQDRRSDPARDRGLARPSARRALPQPPSLCPCHRADRQRRTAVGQEPHQALARGAGRMRFAVRGDRGVADAASRRRAGPSARRGPARRANALPMPMRRPSAPRESPTSTT